MRHGLSRRWDAKNSGHRTTIFRVSSDGEEAFFLGFVPAFTGSILVPIVHRGRPEANQMRMETAGSISAVVRPQARDRAAGNESHRATFRCSFFDFVLQQKEAFMLRKTRFGIVVVLLIALFGVSFENASVVMAGRNCNRYVSPDSTNLQNFQAENDQADSWLTLHDVDVSGSVTFPSDIWVSAEITGASPFTATGSFSLTGGVVQNAGFNLGENSIWFGSELSARAFDINAYGHQVWVRFCQVRVDWGDLPESMGYNTRATSEGASHGMPYSYLRLGVLDGEYDGFPDVNAKGDDTDGIADDEDAVMFGEMRLGETAAITVTVYNTVGLPATLYAFLDWNADGDFGDVSEMMTQTIESTGDVTAILTFTVPIDAATHTPIGVRIRLSTTEGLGPDGPARNGEVEDPQAACHADPTNLSAGCYALSKESCPRPDPHSGMGQIDASDLNSLFLIPCSGSWSHPPHRWMERAHGFPVMFDDGKQRNGSRSSAENLSYIDSIFH